MRLKSVLCFVCALSLLLTHAATAGPASRESILRLTAAADAIVTGSVEATMVNGTVSATIQVERVLKGSLRQGSSVSLVWTQPPNPFGYGKGSSSKSHGLLFLRNTAGSWSLLPATLGDAGWEDTYIRVPRNVSQSLRDVASGSLAADASAVDKVLVELVVSAEAGMAVPIDLVEIFRQSRSPVLTAAFTRFRSKQDSPLMSIGLRGSLASGDPSSILAVRQNYTSLSLRRDWITILEAIKFYYLNSEPQSVQALGQIATDSGVGVDLRIAAATALAKIHTRQSLPYLAKLLDDQNGTLRAMAVGGLSSFANNVPIGSHEPAPGPWSYRTEDTITHSAFDEGAVSQRESYFVDFWQNWWRQNQATLVP